jgi:transmembrane sensor
MDMHAFESPEDLLADESFLAWYFKTDPGAVDKWQEQIDQSPSHRVLVDKAIELLEKLDLQEEPVSKAQIDAAEARLFRQIDASAPQGVKVESVEDQGTESRVVGMESKVQGTKGRVIGMEGQIPGTESRVVGMESRVLGTEGHAIGMESRLGGGKNRRTWMAAAAGVVILVAAGWGARTWMNRNETLSTPYGQIAKSVLPDGTEVTLNAHSSLLYGRHWSEGSDREVWVKGEVFLHVAKKPQHDRFIVHTDHFDVIVTGTSFNVVNREDVSNVVLKEGHVTVHSDRGEEVKMEPGDQVQLEGKDLVKQSVNPEGVIAWTDQKLEFDSATLADVVKTIEQHYGVRVTVEKAALLSYPVNGMLRNDSLNELLKALSALYYKDLNIQREGNQIIIR